MGSLENAISSGMLDDVKYYMETLDAERISSISPVHLAAAAGFLSIVQYLIEDRRLGAHQENSTGQTALQLASQAGHFVIVNFLRSKSD